MCRILLQTVLLLGIALAAGWVHSRLAPPTVHLPDSQPVARPATTGAGPTGPTAPTGMAPAPIPAGPTGQTPKPPIPGTPTGATGAAAAESNWFIDLATAKKIYDSNDAVFVDARTYDEFKEGHIYGAIHIDKKYFDGAAGADIARKQLKGQHVVIYCHGAECTDSEAVAKRLLALNMQIGPIHIIKDGFPGWKAAGYPVNSGPGETSG
jgi:rhodanese-related sulfurtransferase